ncbi:nucleoside-diphosphate kinase [Lacrimispora algidixylanolytica]|uniref:Nucleoside diphosphate kinase-like domain-containing protein n=1 Tax=Lacrimispora algidixylanolytica TaxID=94868 RepID=A0A419T2Q2_9FIRM|nr:nucleoside-diphosphate kinase [Lacrimispora algidixylanolytica]RKD31745.1 hypothetical protein BET01_19690 [Lacrimispora algidixylanolytica]
MSNAFNLKELAEKFDDAQYSMPTHYFSKQELLQEYTFMIITPDAIQRGLVQQIMDFLHDNIEFDIKLLNTCKVSTRQLELLYKHAFKRMFIKGELVYWWLLQESWSIGPCAALLLHSSNCNSKPLIESLLELKGSYHGKGEKTVRALFNSTSMIMNVIHSSDDPYNMIREASIFFNDSDLYNVIEHPGSKNIEVEVLNYQFTLTNQHSSANDIVSIVRLRTYATIAMNFKYALDKTTEKIDLLISSNTYYEFINKVSDSYPNLLHLFMIAYALSGKTDIPISDLEELFDTKDMLLSRWEKVVIKNTLLQSIWSEYYN